MELLLVLLLGGLMHAVRTLGAADNIGPTSAAGLAFGYLLLTAFFAGRMAARLRLPRLTGYIVAGIAVGPLGLGLLSANMTQDLRLVSGLAVCLIALTAGGELDLRQIKPLRRVVWRMTVFAVLGTAVMLTLWTFALREWLPFLRDLNDLQAFSMAAVLGITLSGQSPAVVMALFSETRADGPLTRSVLAVVVAADLVVIVLFGLASALAQAALLGAVDPGQMARDVAWQVLGSVGAGVIAGAVLGLYLVRVGRGIDLFALLICCVIAEVGARLHLDPWVVALAAGVFVQNTTPGGATRLILDLEGASLPIYVVFFALAGAGLQLGLLPAVAGPALALITLRALGIRLGSWVATRGPEVPPAVQRYAYVGLLPQAGLVLAMALVIERTFPGIGEGAAALVLGIVAVNELLMPMALKYALTQAGEVGRARRPDSGQIALTTRASPSSVAQTPAAAPPPSPAVPP